MHPGYPCGNGETESGPGRLSIFAVTRARLIRPVKALENMRLCIGGDAPACICYPDQITISVASNVNRDMAARRSMFNRVIEQVQNHAPDQALVAAKQELFFRM